MSAQVISGSQVVDVIVPGWKPEQDRLGIYPFTLRVVVIRARPPRHRYFEFTRDMGSGLMDKIFSGSDGLTRGPGAKLVFFFPERHMSVQEQREFMHAISRHKEVGNIEHMDIVTSSPIILSDFPNNVVRVVDFPEDKGVYTGA